MLRSCFLSSFVEFRSAVSEEKSKMSQPIRGQGGHLVFPIGPKNTNLGMLRSCFLSSFDEFRSAVSEQKSKMSKPIRGQGGHLVFPIGPKKHKLGRRHWDLASCQVLLNSVKWFQRRSRKCEKLTTMDRRRTDGRRTTHDQKSIYLCFKNKNNFSGGLLLKNDYMYMNKRTKGLLSLIRLQ